MNIYRRSLKAIFDFDGSTAVGENEARFLLCQFVGSLYNFFAALYLLFSIAEVILDLLGLKLVIFLSGYCLTQRYTKGYCRQIDDGIVFTGHHIECHKRIQSLSSSSAFILFRFVHVHCIFAEVGVLSKEEALLGFFTIFIIISIIIIHIFDFLFIFNHILCVSVLLDLAKPNLVRNRNKYNNINKPTNYIHIFLINLCLFY